MKDLRFFRSVCSWAHVLFSIIRVLSCIGAIGLLFGIFYFVALPQNTFSIDSTVAVDVKVNLKRLMGKEWPELYAEMEEELKDELQGELPDNAVVSEEGIEVKETVPAITMENRVFALSMIPSFVEMILGFSLYLFLARAFKILKLAQNPFDSMAAKHLRTAGIFLMVQATVPAICMTLVSNLTRTSGYFQTEFDLFAVFLGFLLWALSDLFLYANEKLSTPLYTPPPFGGFPAENKPEETKENSDIHPDAF